MFGIQIFPILHSVSKRLWCRSGGLLDVKIKEKPYRDLFQ